MKVLFRIVAAVLFVVFFGFALKNTQEAALQLFLGYEIRGPLVLLLLGFLTAGAALGVLAMTPTVLRYRRDVSKYKKAIAVMQKEGDVQQYSRIQPPQPDSVVNP